MQAAELQETARADQQGKMEDGLVGISSVSGSVVQKFKGSFFRVQSAAIRPHGCDSVCSRIWRASRRETDMGCGRHCACLHQVGVAWVAKASADFSDGDGSPLTSKVIKGKTLQA